jgi:hypothetical protein
MLAYLIRNVLVFAKTCVTNPRRRYAAAFVFCIPAFAVLYSVIPRGFYQSTIKTESIYSEQATGILQELCRAVALELPAAPNSSAAKSMQFTQSVGSWSFSPRSDLKCDRLRITNEDQLGFTVTVTLWKNPRCPSVISEICYDIVSIPFVVTFHPMEVKSSVVEAREFVPIDSPTFPLDFNHPIDVSVGKSPPRLPNKDKLMLSDLVGVLFKGKDSEYETSIVLSDQLEREIGQFFLASDGFTSEANGHFWRMLYFSAVTISTLGYGDIVPVSALARALVTLEVVSGLLLVGLFLNSLKTPEAGHKD